MSGQQDLRIKGWVEMLRIETLGEWDVLCFLCRHATSLASAEQISRLVGYGTGAVGEALTRLEMAGLVERSRARHGVRLHRFRASGDESLQSCFGELMRLCEDRAGRLLLRKHLRLPGPRKNANVQGGLQST